MSDGAGSFRLLTYGRQTFALDHDVAVNVSGLRSDPSAIVAAPVIICVDNKAAVDICKAMGVTKRSKHFTDAIHYFRRCYFHKEIFPILVDTHNQCADGFTKPLEKVKFKPWCSRVLRLK